MSRRTLHPDESCYRLRRLDDRLLVWRSKEDAIRVHLPLGLLTRRP